jgi:hypothetical protein
MGTRFDNPLAALINLNKEVANLLRRIARGNVIYCFDLLLDITDQRIK